MTDRFSEEKPMTFPDRRTAAIQRARELRHLDLAEKIEKLRYASDIRKAMEELSQREQKGENI